MDGPPSHAPKHTSSPPPQQLHDSTSSNITAPHSSCTPINSPPQSHIPPDHNGIPHSRSKSLIPTETRTDPSAVPLTSAASSSSSVGRRMTLGPATPTVPHPRTSAFHPSASFSSLPQHHPAPTSPKQNWIKALGQHYASPSMKSIYTEPPEISLEDWISTSVQDYQMDTVIGIGSSAFVYSAYYKPGNRRVAVKVIDLDNFERNQIEELRKETQVMSLCKHPNVLPVHAAFVTESKLFIVTPFLSAGSVLDIMKHSFADGLDEISVSTILKQILHGLDYLHKNSHIHRDVKAGNVLLDSNGTAVLADLGVAASLEAADRKATRKTFVGTPCWMAPEVMEHAAYDFHADIWSFGITVLEMATGRAPLAKYPPVKILMLTLNNNPPILDLDATKYKYSKSARDLTALCLQKNPNLRPTSEKLLSHSFFSKAKKPAYLVGTLLAGLPSLTERSKSRNLHQFRHRKVSSSSGKASQSPVSWDFSVDSPQSDHTFGHSRSSSLHTAGEGTARLSSSVVGLGINENAADGQDGTKVQFTAASNPGSPPPGIQPGAGVKHAATAPSSVSEFHMGKDQADTESQTPPANHTPGETQPVAGPSVLHRRGRFEVSVEPSANPTSTQTTPVPGSTTTLQPAQGPVSGVETGTTIGTSHMSLSRQQSLTLPSAISSGAGTGSNLRRESSLSSASNASSSGTAVPFMSALANVTAAAALHHANSVGTFHTPPTAAAPAPLNQREVDALLRRHEMTFSLLSSVADRIGVRSLRLVPPPLPPLASTITVSPISLSNPISTPTTPQAPPQPNPPQLPLLNTTSLLPESVPEHQELPVPLATNTAIGNSLLDSLGTFQTGITALVRENEQLRADNDRLRKELERALSKGTG